LITQLGLYETRDGRVVAITKIYQSQPIAEGMIDQKTYVWMTDGRVDKWRDTPRDIVRFISDWDSVYDTD
jgi:hypothetical protein